MTLFREAEWRVQAQFPTLRAEALIAATQPTGDLWCDVYLPACLAAARDGLAGIHIIPDPYNAEMDWIPVYDWATRASDAGLGLAAHVGEFDTTNITAALQVPGLTRLDHAVYAAETPGCLSRCPAAGSRSSAASRAIQMLGFSLWVQHA
jgi:hypothetical protein